jgi:hypothetical protein
MEGKQHNSGVNVCRFECWWTVKCEVYRNSIAHDNALHETVKDNSFPSHAEQYVKLKIKTIRTRYAAEPAKVMKYEKSGAGLDDVHANKSFSFQRAYSCPR